MEPIRMLRERYTVLPIDNIDTDQIIPARFLKGTTRLGLGQHLFAGWREGPNGEPQPDFVLNRPEATGARILLAGENFGCGSSREHAPWALVDYGFRAIISVSFADIFRANALKNGLLPVAIDPDRWQALARTPGEEVVIDLDLCTWTGPDGRSVPFPIDPFARHCLMRGIDELDYLLDQEETIATYERDRP